MEIQIDKQKEMGFLKLLLGRDQMGYEPKLTYMGNQQYRTKLGAVLTLLVQLLVIMQLIKQLVKLVEMSEPNVHSYQRPMYEYEITDLGEVVLS